MKTLFILASVMVVFSLAAPNEIEAQKKSAGSGNARTDIFRQLVRDSRASAPDLSSWDEIEINKPARYYIDVKAVPLSPGRIMYLVAGNAVPFYGAHAPMFWIYEKTKGGYRQIDDLGANYDVRLLKTSHNRFRDLGTSYVLGAGTLLSTCKLIFNGNKYVSAGCKEKRIRN